MERGVLLVLGSVTINAFSPVVFKYLYGFIDPLSMNVFLGALSLFFSVLLFRPGREVAKKVRENPKLFLIAGIGGYGLNSILYLVGLSLTTMSSAVLMIQSTYIFTILFAFAFLKERANGWEIGGIALTALGILLVAWNGTDLGELLKSENFVGNVLIFVSGLCWSVYVLGQKKLFKKIRPVEALPVFLLINTITGTFAVILAGSRVEAGFLEAFPLFCMLFVSISGGVIGFVLGMEGIRRVKLITANMVGSMYPVMGIIFSVIFLSESLSAYQMMGALGIILGSALGSAKAGPT